MMKALAVVEILRTSGNHEKHQVGKHILLDWIRRMIGAEVTDTVNLRDGRIMIVNDDGWETETIENSPGHITLKPLRAKLPINEQATTIYHGVCRPGTTHQIAGDVAIARDEDFA